MNSSSLRLSSFLVVLCCSCSNSTVSDDSPGPQGLSVEGRQQLRKLLEASSDQEFATLAAEQHQSERPESVLILTHAMIRIEFPQGTDVNPRDIPKTRKGHLERLLDRLVASQEHDQLSAQYFRALLGNGNTEEAAANLLRWTIESLPRFEWDGEGFTLKDQ